MKDRDENAKVIPTEPHFKFDIGKRCIIDPDTGIEIDVFDLCKDMGIDTKPIEYKPYAYEKLNAPTPINNFSCLQFLPPLAGRIILNNGQTIINMPESEHLDKIEKEE